MLPLVNRLKDKKFINQLFRTGKFFSNEVLMIRLLPLEKIKPSRFSFGVSLNFSKKATERNKVKRWIREAVRAKINKIESGWGAIILVNPKIIPKDLDFDLISKKTENLLKKAKIL